jgi:hypothetical protein
MFRQTVLTVAMLAAIALLAGCKTPEQMKAEYPDWPNWGWWDKPGQSKEAAAAPAPPPASTAEPLPGDDTLAARGDDAARVDAPAEATIVSFETADLLTRHRADAWKTVSMLRDLDARPEAERQQLLDRARAELPAWYQPMPDAAPDPNQPDWVKVLIWDFMPEDDFQRAIEGWRAIARKENMEFPYPATRRKVMAFVETLLDAAGQTPADGDQVDAPAEPVDVAEPVEPVEPLDGTFDDGPLNTTPTPAEIPPVENEMDTPNE